ncbi:MAG TPA: hypothetical protein DCM28_10220 [Phycisphaerales bacterium]|nr:hypothetical protein [Phycisphaerales bacterium]HCD33483.1 hypothetical protein [Phycisphaerales bacterium]|tara:strand:- start:139 stop:1017 length:879 start_codon:yes stop_codon:yes gene_type:complete
MGIGPSSHVRFLEHALDFELVCGRCIDVPKGQVFGWHADPLITMIHLVKGKAFCEFCVDPSTAKKVCIQTGQVLVIPPGQTFRWGSRKTDSHVRQAQFKGTLLDCVDLSDMYELPLVLKGDLGIEAGAAIDSLKGSYFCKSKHDLHEMIHRKQLCFQIMALLTRDAVFKGDAQHLFAQTQRLLPVFRLIHENLHTELNREMLASEMNLSPSRFSALFASCTGQSPMQYVRQARLRQVQHLLWTTNMTVGQIAQKLQFYDAFHLSKQFSKAFDISPTDFRRSAGNISLFHAAS